MSRPGVDRGGGKENHLFTSVGREKPVCRGDTGPVKGSSTETWVTRLTEETEESARVGSRGVLSGGDKSPETRKQMSVEV